LYAVFFDEDDETDAIIGGTTVASGQQKFMVRYNFRNIFFTFFAINNLIKSVHYFKLALV
jgi:hypothetical protein